MNRISPLVVLALAAAAPAAAQSKEEPPLPLAAFVDSAALHQALASAPPAPAEFKRKLILTVTLDSLGGTPAVEVVGDRHVPKAYADAMAALMRAHLRPQERAPKERMQWVWLRSGSEPLVAPIRGMVEARPVLSNRSYIAQELGRSTQTLVDRNVALAGRTLTIELRMRVDEEGRPVRVLVTRGADHRVNQEAARLAQRMRFRPATVEGYPVAVLVDLPINLTFPQPSSPDGPGGMPRP